MIPAAWEQLLAHGQLAHHQTDIFFKDQQMTTIFHVHMVDLEPSQIHTTINLAMVLYLLGGLSYKATLPEIMRGR